MLIKIVGIEHQDYKLDNGYSFKGIKLHAEDMSTLKEKLEGNLTTTIKIAEDSPHFSRDFRVGTYHRCYFTQKGTLDCITEVDPADVVENV